jgi:hypothetical protein
VSAPALKVSIVPLPFSTRTPDRPTAGAASDERGCDKTTRIQPASTIIDRTGIVWIDVTGRRDGSLMKSLTKDQKIGPGGVSGRTSLCSARRILL